LGGGGGGKKSIGEKKKNSLGGEKESTPKITLPKKKPFNNLRFM
jgi:hypothetical protein